MPPRDLVCSWMIAAEDLFSGTAGILADCPTLY
jgi:hypothetical protein